MDLTATHALSSMKYMTLHLIHGGLLVRLETCTFHVSGEVARMWMEILTGFLLILVKRRGIPYYVLIFKQRGLDLCLFRVILVLIIFCLYQ